MKFNTVMINSENPDKLVEFYDKVLGKNEWSQEGFTGWKVGDSYVMTGPHSEVHGSNKEPGRIMINFECEDVQAEFDRIKGLGATVVSEPEHPGGEPSMTLACLADPDGNYFQLASPMPEDMSKDK